MTTAQKKVIAQIIQQISAAYDGRWRVNHKRCWLDYLNSGRLSFTPEQLYDVITQVVNLPGNLPRGEKLFHLRQKFNFTIKEDRTPYRTEEALERFIVMANRDRMYNQTPIGGGKESIDIVVQLGQSVEFVELKAWQGGDSPLYALVEGLKNLIEYRVIEERKITNIKIYPQIMISVLAPASYYQDYALLDNDGKPIGENIERARKLLRVLGKAFNAALSLKYLSLSSDAFNDSCAKIFMRNQVTGQCSVAVTEHDVLDPLRLEAWTDLASSAVR